MSFKNVRISTRVELGAQGGPGFKTTIIETSSGDEYRNIDWSRQRGRWEIGYTDNMEIIEEIIAFFQVMRGRAYGFRFRDWSDYKVDNVIAVGDGETKEFQAAKVYQVDESAQFIRPLTRLDGATVVLSDDNDTEVAATPMIDENTGKITFSVAPPTGYKVKLKGQFDVPVRFDTDELPVTMLTQNVARIESVPIIEIRDRQHG